jgi:hypothetical protein
LVLGLLLIIIGYSLFYGGFDQSEILTIPSLEFVVTELVGFILLIWGAARLTEGLGPP